MHRLKRYFRQKIYELIDSYVRSKYIDISFFEKIHATYESAMYAIENMSASHRCRDLFSLLDIALDNRKALHGLLLEFGVFDGRSINYMSNKLPDRTFYGFDSFEGLPEGWRHGFGKGAFNMGGRLPNVNSNVKLIKGWFDRSLPEFLQVHEGPVEFVYIDCDLYSSTQTILECLSDRLVSGSVIVFDEYFNYAGWKLHEYKAFQEFVKMKKIRYEYLAFNPVDQQVTVRIL